MKKKICLLALLLTVGLLRAQSTQYADVAVIVNDSSSNSIAVGNYFAQQRGIPASRVLHISMAPAGTIDSLGFENLRSQVEAALIGGNLLDSVQYLVTTMGVPPRVSVRNGCDSAFFPASGAFNRCTSVESELALILGPHASGILSTVPSYNPYYDAAKHFDRDSTGIFLVSRLDGFSVFRAQQLVDHGGPDRQYVVADAEIVLDHFSIDSVQSSLLPFVSSYHHNVELQMSALGYAVLNDSNPGTFVQNHPHVLANLAAFEQDSLVTVVEPNLDFLPGSAAFLWTDQDPLFADDQSLYTAIDAITDGAAVVCSRVGIGYFGTGVQPIAFLTRYADTTTTDRFNAAEAYYLSVPHLSAQHVMYGDPKTSILPSVTLSAENPLALPPFALFPNPTHGSFTVRLQDAAQGDVSLQILDLQGKLMLQKLQLGGSFLEVDASGLAQGFYMVQVRQGERSASKKLSVLH